MIQKKKKMSAKDIKETFDSAEAQRIRSNGPGGARLRSQEIAKMSGPGRVKAATEFRDQMLEAGVPVSNIYMKMMNSFIWTSSQSMRSMDAPNEWNTRNAADRGLFY